MIEQNNRFPEQNFIDIDRIIQTVKRYAFVTDSISASDVCDIRAVPKNSRPDEKPLHKQYADVAREASKKAALCTMLCDILESKQRLLDAIEQYSSEMASILEDAERLGFHLNI